MTRMATVFLVGLVLLSSMGAVPSLARNDDGKWDGVDPKIQEWIGGLTNENGTPCCSTADGIALNKDAVVYDTQNGHYRVQIKGTWYVIQDAQLLKIPNLIGRAIVWYRVEADGTVFIYCFIDGGGF